MTPDVSPAPHPAPALTLTPGRSNAGGQTWSQKVQSNVEHPIPIKYEMYHISADQGRIFRKVLEWFASLAAILLGGQFILNGFGPYHFLYLPMEMTGSALSWGTIMLSLGIVRASILLVNGWWPHTHMARKWLSAAFIMLVWAPMAACFWWSFLSNLYAGRPATYPGIAYSMFSVTAELLIFYAHTSFTYITRKGAHG